MTLYRQLSMGDASGQGSDNQGNKRIRIPEYLGYRVGPKGGYILWDKRISDGNDGREWYASYREKKKYNLLKP